MVNPGNGSGIGGGEEEGPPEGPAREEEPLADSPVKGLVLMHLWRLLRPSLQLVLELEAPGQAGRTG